MLHRVTCLILLTVLPLELTALAGPPQPVRPSMATVMQQTQKDIAGYKTVGSILDILKRRENKKPAADLESKYGGLRTQLLPKTKSVGNEIIIESEPRVSLKVIDLEKRLFSVNNI